MRQGLGIGESEDWAGNRGDIKSDQNKMSKAAQDHKNVPDFVETENIGEKIRFFNDINHRSNGEHNPAGNKPENGAGRHRHKDLAGSDHSQPAHD